MADRCPATMPENRSYQCEAAAGHPGNHVLHVTYQWGTPHRANCPYCRVSLEEHCPHHGCADGAHQAP